jgi:hypothetical protein
VLAVTGPLATLKLQFDERRARVVPRAMPDGAAFAGPGADVTGPDFDELARAAEAALAWFAALEPGVRVRSLLLDFGALRAIATVADAPPAGAPAPRPRVVRVEGAPSADLFARAAPLAALAAAHAARRIAARQAPRT